MGHGLAASLVIRNLSEIEISRQSGTLAALGRFTPGSLRKTVVDIPELLRVSSGHHTPRSEVGLTHRQIAWTIPFDPTSGRIHHNPTCRLMNSGLLHLPENDSVGKQQRGVFLAGETREWTTWSWKEKIKLVAKEPGSILSVSFHIPPPPGPMDDEDEMVIAAEEAAEEAAETTLDFEERQFPFEEQTKGGRVLIEYQRSATLGLGTV